MTPDDSRADLEGLRAGDPAALQALVVRHMDGLEGYLRLRMGARLRARESCSDLVQSVCREVLRDLDRFDYRGEAAFRHWLYTRARHKLAHRFRDLGAERRDPRRERPLDDVLAGRGGAALMRSYGLLATPSRALAEREAIARIEAAFDELPEDYREALTMRRLMGLEYPAIAEHMQRSEGAVRNLVHRAIARLTILLADVERD
ncbi:MAG: sigma-70 family RNA polymerase sigma factor [Planctomycetes bacterium]|nr:sigma-70 family RNA polymerase sigma factor [Planctomycetota bacterium]